MSHILADLLAEEIGCLRDFLAAISAEQAILVAGKVDELESAATKKAQVAEKLNALDAKRNIALQSTGFEASRDGMEALLVTDQGLDLADAWKELLVLASKAKHENEINGRLIGSKLQQNQQALAILLGDKDNGITYGPNGQQAALSGRRPIGHA